MLLDAENQKFDTLLVKDVSRFARNTVDGLTSLRLLQDNDIEVMFINNMGIAGSNEFLITIYFAIAQQESENTSKRVKFGKKQNMNGNGSVLLFISYSKSPSIRKHFSDLSILLFQLSTLHLCEVTLHCVCSSSLVTYYPLSGCST